MSKHTIIKPDESYSFSRYFELSFDAADILAEFDCTLSRQKLNLPRHSESIDCHALKQQIETDLLYVDLTSETARREVLIAPVLLQLCRLTKTQLKIEYPIQVSNQLKGNLDYYLRSKQNLLVVEAKHADISRGFTQMAIELIALDRWTDLDTPLLYGAITTGETWKFGIFDRQAKQIWQDINLYQVPAGLAELLAILVGILQSPIADQAQPLFIANI